MSRQAIKQTFRALSPSMQSFSATHGVPLSLLKTAKQSSCPAFDAANRIHIAQFFEWLFTSEAGAEILSQFSAGSFAVNHRDNYEKARAEKITAEVDEIKRRTIRYVDVDGFVQELFGGIFADIERIFCNEYPPIVKAMTDEIEIHRKTTLDFKLLKVKFKDRLDRWLKDNKPIEDKKEKKK